MNPIKHVLLSAILVCALLSGCKDKGNAKPESQPLVPPPAPTAEAPENKKVPEAPSKQATAEQSTATVRLVVTIGGLPPRVFTGAILHKDAFEVAASAFEKARGVVALVKGLTEDQLRDRAAQFRISRNLPDTEGEFRERGFSANLIDHDAKSGLTLFSFQTNINAVADTGYRVVGDDGNSKSGDPIWAEANTFFPAGLQPGQAPRMRLFIGQYDRRNSQGALTRPALPEGVILADTALIASGGTLHGFVDSAGSTDSAFVSLLGFDLTRGMSRLRVESIGFGQIESHVPIVIKFGQEGDRPITQGCGLYQRELASGETFELPKGGPPHARISESAIAHGAAGSIAAMLQVPPVGVKEVTHVLQVGWRPFSFYGGEIYSKPFLVRLKRDGNSVAASAEGITNLNEAAAASDTRLRTLTLEAPARQIMEIAGGRELLVQFEGAPFWKRFSLERQDWLPLPAINPAVVDLTGDLSAIYALDRGAAVVRKYALDDLRLLAEVKMPTANMTYLRIRAGCNTQRGPVLVVASDQVIALSPEKLLRLDSPAPPDRRERAADSASNDSVVVTGDGLSVYGASVPGGRHVYNGAFLRTGMKPLGFEYGPMEAPVSSAYSFNGMGWLTTCIGKSGNWEATPHPKELTEVHYTFPNSPVGVVLRFPTREAIPPLPAKAELYSFFQEKPFAIVELPEFARVPRILSNKSKQVQFNFDPHSMTLSVLSPDRKTWTLHEVKPFPDADPALLNWPDANVERGGEFKFTAKLSKKADITATLSRGGAESPVAVSGSDLSAKILPDEIASILLLKFNASAGGANSSYTIPLHIRGPIFPIASGPDAPKVTNLFAASFKTVQDPIGQRKALPSRFYYSSDPIKEVVGPMAGHLALVTGAGRVDIVSTETLKVTRSIRASKDAAHFSGAECLFSYEPALRTLTRYGVADAARDRSITLPSGQHLSALGIGANWGSPLTLMLEKRTDERSGQIGNWTLTTWNRNIGISILGSDTLQPGAWPAPKFFETKDADNMGEGFGFLGGSGGPVRIVGSRNGQLLVLPRNLAILTPGFSVGVPFGTPLGEHIYNGDTYGSITGIFASNHIGGFSRNGVVTRDLQRAGPAANSPCGRYKLQRGIGREVDDRGLEVCSLETDEILLRLNRLIAYDEEFNDSREKKIRFLGDGGPIVVIGEEGKLLQFVDLDVPKLAAELSPASFHVTSQPSPVVFAGGVYDYQVAVNNPAAVASQKLLQEVPGATFSESGLLRYTAPATLAEPTRVNIDIVLTGKNGTEVRHQFPLLVVPKTVPGQIPGVRLGTGGR